MIVVVGSTSRDYGRGLHHKTFDLFHLGFKALKAAGMVACILSTIAAPQAIGRDLPIRLSASQIKAAGITVAAARPPAAGTSTSTGNSLTLAGRVTIPNHRMGLVTASTGGQIQAVLINVGERVSVGSPLARLYSSSLLGMQRQYLQARTTAQLLAEKFHRDEALFEAGIIAHSRLDEARSALFQAQAAVQEQRQLLRLAGVSTSDIDKLVQASDIDPVLTITSRMSGVVLEQNATPGSHVEAGTPLFTIGDTQTLWVELQATAAQLSQLKIGAAARAVGCGRSGKVIAISPQLSRDAQTALVRAEFTGAAECLRPNQYAEVSINGDGSQAVVSIPIQALIRSGGKDYVFVQSAAGFTLQEVTVQARQGAQAWVSDSLPAGTQVVVTGIAALRGAAGGLGPEE